MIHSVSFVWVGLVLGVSFLATPIKFQAESLSLPVALDVGRVTFHALAKVQWMLCIVLFVGVVRSSRSDSIRAIDWVLAGFVFTIVALQAMWLIPKLDIRVAATIAGEPLPKSHLHAVFAGVEFAKVLALILLGISPSTDS